MSTPSLFGDERKLLARFPDWVPVRRNRVGHLIVQCGERREMLPRKIGSDPDMHRGVICRLRRGVVTNQ